MPKQRTECSEIGCATAVVARGLCAKHYNFAKNHGLELPPRIRGFRGVPCAVEDCSRPARGAGFCGMHYHRKLRHGSPTDGATFTGEPKEWMDKHLAFEGDECLPWPFERNTKGYGTINLRGRKRQTVASYVCEKVHGPKPTPKHEAAHNCGKGHEGCVNGKHLRWATRQENQMDRVEHGTSPRGEMHPQTSLTWADVRKIREMCRYRKQIDIADEYSLSASAISAIHTRRNWKHDPLNQCAE